MRRWTSSGMHACAKPSAPSTVGSPGAMTAPNWSSSASRAAAAASVRHHQRHCEQFPAVSITVLCLSLEGLPPSPCTPSKPLWRALVALVRR
eukprot:744715-Alexandrium_andersonii.AAC.1